MDLKEVWIGENIKVRSSGRIGKYEGISKDGRARVSSAGKIYLVKATNLEKYTEPKTDKVKAIKEELTGGTIGLGQHLQFDTTLDLHIRKLSPDLEHSSPEHILQFQLRACRAYITKAIENRASTVVIIHGKGTGVLRSEVIECIKSFAEVGSMEAINNNGAQRLFFRY